jgi:hypothetical protein
VVGESGAEVLVKKRLPASLWNWGRGLERWWPTEEMKDLPHVTVRNGLIDSMEPLPKVGSLLLANKSLELFL